MDQTYERLITASNPHWKGIRPDAVSHPREIEARLIDLLDERQILCLLGPRRTGKTTLLKRAIRHLLEKGVPPRQVFYFSFDEIMSMDHRLFEQVIDHYFDNISEDPEGKAYVLLDEIHNIDFWQAILKRHYDQLHPKAKFIVTGSSSLWIKRRSRESLAGRSFDLTVRPLTFREYLEFRGLKLPVAPRPSRYSNIEGYWKGLAPHIDDIQRAFNRYLLFGGFPETTAEGQTLERNREYLWTYVVEKTILRDLTQYFPVENPRAIVEILRVLSWQSSRLFSMQNLAETLNMKARTVSKYLSYLEIGYLVGFSYNLTKSRVKQVRSSKKAYLTDTGLIVALANLGEDVFSHPEEIGGLVESTVWRHFAGITDCYFWNDEHKNEVDLVCRFPRSLLPIEVKYVDRLTNRDFRALRLFQKKHGSRQHIIATRSALEDHGDVWAIPVPLLLLLDWSGWSMGGRGKKTQMSI